MTVVMIGRQLVVLNLRAASHNVSRTFHSQTTTDPGWPKPYRLLMQRNARKTRMSGFNATSKKYDLTEKQNDGISLDKRLKQS